MAHFLRTWGSLPSKPNLPDWQPQQITSISQCNCRLPPVDYSEDKLDDTVRQLQKRFQQKRRFVIWYRNSKGEERTWDLDKSELRHNGVYLL